MGKPLVHESWVYSASFSADGSQVVTVSGDPTARVWDVPIVSLSEAERLADLAEAVGGLAVNDQGAVVRVSDRDKRLARLRRAAEAAPDGQATVLSFARWRTISPLSAVMVPQYICDAIRRGAVDEARRAFPGHPLLRGDPTPEAPPPECAKVRP